MRPWCKILLATSGKAGTAAPDRFTQRIALWFSENRPVKKTPFRLTPYQVQFLLVVGFVTVGYALYIRDPVFILGQGFGVFVYARNLYFELRDRRKAAAA